MNIKLTNGKKTIVRLKVDYEANLNHFKMRGFTPHKEEETPIEKETTKDISDKVVQLKPKKKKEKKK
jgi:hypothetical protein|tara:strand:- start:2302 stop:2502 length:201 start_codon:yes stop_codon:yes gene_type:complete